MSVCTQPGTALLLPVDTAAFISGGSGLHEQLCKHSCSADFLNQEENFGVTAFQVPSLMQGAEGWSGHSKRPEQQKTGSVPPGTDALFIEDGLQV